MHWTRFLTFLVELFPLAGLVVLLFSFLSPVVWRLNPSPTLQLRQYVAPEGYLPDIPCTAANNGTLLLASTIAGLLNSTNSTTTPQNALSVPLTAQDIFAKGGEGGGSAADILGSIIDSVSSAVSSTSGSSDNKPPIAPHGDFDKSPNATIRVWLGPLGSCTRDLDGRKWCTKPSFWHPTYNLSSFVQPNAFLYPAIIQSQTLARTTLAFIILAGLSCLVSLLGNISGPLNIPSLVYNIIIAISQFVTLWVWLSKGSIEAGPGSTDPRQLNTVNRLFQCNQTTGEIQLMPGTQYYVQMGEHYGLLWVSWVLIYVLGTTGSAIRYAVFDD